MTANKANSGDSGAVPDNVENENESEEDIYWIDPDEFCRAVLRRQVVIPLHKGPRPAAGTEQEKSGEERQ
jgi:hypothetical protein